VDTNGSILTYDYLDELVEAGMTDIGIDLKSLEDHTYIDRNMMKWSMSGEFFLEQD
jgi:molybdenum cofactor biosynthesis enzyme MoaA